MCAVGVPILRLVFPRISMETTSLHTNAQVNNDQTIDFKGQNYEIATTARKSVAIIHHPNRKFWVFEQLPKNAWPCLLGAFSL